MEDSKKASLQAQTKDEYSGCENFTLENVKSLPIVGVGDEAPLFYDLILTELAAEHKVGGDVLATKLRTDMAEDPVAQIPGHIYTCLSRGASFSVSPMLEAFCGLVTNVSLPYSLLTYWQLSVIKKFLKLDFLGTDQLSELQKKLGSPVWPNGTRMPALSGFSKFWTNQTHASGYPTLLISDTWPFFDPSQGAVMYSRPNMEHLFKLLKVGKL